MRSETGEPVTNYHGSGETPLEAIWETLCKGKPSEVNTGRFSVSMASAKAIFMALGTDDVESVLTEHFENSKDAMDYFADELEVWRFCVTQTGYMGLFPQETETGDVVMAVDGARVPFIFRAVQENKTYRLVGECYLHGIMTGELSGELRFEERFIV